VFYAASLVLSVPAGMVSERFGPQRSLLAGVTITVVAMLGVAVAVRSWTELVAWLFLAGVGNTIGQVGTNHLLATAVRPDRQGLSYGVKQASIPIAGVIAGLALPTIGLTIGWRWAFAIGAALSVGVFMLAGRPRPFTRPAGRSFREGDAPLAALLVIAAAAGLGAAAGNALASFTVESAVARGFEPSAAGLLLMVGSLCGATMRVLSGWIGDRLGRSSLLVVICLQVIGVAGYLALALAGTSALMVVLATMLAFAGGWGYQGLVLLAISRSNPTSPAIAMGVVRLGPSAGAMIGPLLAGAIVTERGYDVAWLVITALALLAAVLMFTGRVLLLRHREAVAAIAA
jgi:MFS family permease